MKQQVYLGEIIRDLDEWNWKIHIHINQEIRIHNNVNHEIAIPININK